MSAYACGMPGPQLGIPLDEEHFSAMSAEKRDFLRNLLEQAQREIKIAERRGEHFPLVPSNYLRVKYRQALAEHGGWAYCQVRQMRVLFLL